MADWCIKLCIVVCLLNFSNSVSNALNKTDSTLRYVQILLRHGKRTPLTYFEDDINNNFWQDNVGKLTKEGKNESYFLGKWFRRRYQALLSDYRDNDETIIRSTDKDRTLATAQLFGAGLYPPKGQEIWNDELGTVWQPTPVHTLPVDQDPFADNFALDFCPRFDQLMTALRKTAEVKRHYNESKGLIELINNKIRKNEKFGNDIIGLIYGADTLAIEAIFGLKPPDWIANDITKVFQALEYFTYNYVKTPDLIHLAGGYLAKHFFDNMQNAVMNKTKEKVRVFSAHDYTIIFLLSAMRMFNDIMPPFSAAVIVELHENDLGNYFVQVFYKNSTSMEDPYVLQFPGCNSDLCPFQTALDSVKDLFVSNLSDECSPLNADELNRKELELMKQFI